jgi:4'-phosphopantetheinyl transferase
VTFMYVNDKTRVKRQRKLSRSVRGENHCSFKRQTLAARLFYPQLVETICALGVRVVGSGMAHLQRPLILFRRGCPYPVSLSLTVGVVRFAAVGKQRGYEPKGIYFVTQAHQIHLFCPQHFIYVFHSRQVWPTMALHSFRVVMNRVLLSGWIRPILIHNRSNFHRGRELLVCGLALSVISWLWGTATGKVQVEELMAGGRGVDPDPLRHLDGVLPAHEVHVWSVDLRAWEEAAGQLLELLDPEERERAGRFKFPEPRNQFIISRALLRRALGGYLHIDATAVRFCTTSDGKPELAVSPNVRTNDLRFNLSHTEGATVFAVVRQRQVGIDVERIRIDTNAMELAERFFSPREVQWLRSRPASEQVSSFFSCWTAKEAYIKAHGEGLSMSLSGFGVLPGTGSKLQLNVYADPAEARRWSIWQLELGTDLRAALAVEGKSCRVRVGQWPSPHVDLQCR